MFWKKAINDVKNWLEIFQESNHCWSSCHTACQQNIVNYPEMNSILPLIREKFHTLETQYHCMNIIDKTFSIVNPNQTPIDVSDQPALHKKRSFPLRISTDLVTFTDEMENFIFCAVLCMHWRSKYNDDILTYLAIQSTFPCLVGCILRRLCSQLMLNSSRVVD